MNMVLIDYQRIDLYVQVNDEGAGEGIYSLKRYDRERQKWLYNDVTDLFVEQAQEEIFAKGEQQHKDEMENEIHE